MKKETIYAYALKNALAHNGEARVGAVISSLFQEGLKKEELPRVMSEIKEIVSKINALSLEEQQESYAKLQDIVKQREHREGLPELRNAEQGKVKMRFAPFPSGPLHIGNARQAIINDEYAKHYKGKLLLVIDDTIGSKEKQILPQAYKLIPEALDWLQVDYAKPIIYKSDRLKLYYKHAEELIKQNRAYACFCDAETLRENRERSKACKHRNHSVHDNIKYWKAMLAKKYKEGKATLRIKTGMEHSNPAFRDRVLFRISKRSHPRTKKKYAVWPLLEFSWAIDDHLLGITHIIRGKELMIESEMEQFIWNIFGWKHPEILHTGLLQLEGVKLGKSKSRAEILAGHYKGWNDPRTWSLQSLRERGIQPEALRTFILGFGLTQTEIAVPIESLYRENVKLVENANRYFFVADPIKITIKKAPKLKVKARLHPSQDKGFREFETGTDFYVARKDYENMKQRQVYRFMHLFNFVKDKGFVFHSREHDKKLNAIMLHWLPSKKTIKAEVLMPDGSVIKGFCEEVCKKLKKGDVIQFERFGFCSLYKKSRAKLEFWFAHS